MNTLDRLAGIIERWYDSDGNYHRDDGPAIIYASGHKAWLQHGRFHQDNGPAVIQANGDTEWYQYGKLNRTDGPAIEFADGRGFFWLNNRHLPFDEWANEVDLSDEDKVMMKLKYG